MPSGTRIITPLTGNEYVSIDNDSPLSEVAQTKDIAQIGVAKVLASANTWTEGQTFGGGLQASNFLTLPSDGRFWADLDGGSPSVVNLSDRVRIGAATATNDNRTTNSVQTNWGSYAAWAPRDADLVAMSQRGSLALVGMSRASDGAAIASPPASIGVGGFVLVDTPNIAGWGLYSDVQFTDGTGWATGLEVAAKNASSVNKNSTPYDIGGYGGVYGLWLAGGGDNAYGPAATHPSDTAIAVIKSSHTWNNGIIFAKDALTGADGSTGTATAIGLGKGHKIVWSGEGGVAGGSITSNVSNASSSFDISFENNYFLITGPNGKSNFLSSHSANAVNFIQLTANSTGNGAAISANGDDTNIDLWLSPKGSGTVVVWGSIKTTGDVTLHPGAAVAPANNGDLMIQATSNTSLTFKYKGSDGTIRTASLALS